MEKITYSKIFHTLFSDDIEEYIPDGVSISHPVVALIDNVIIDYFVLYYIKNDRTGYTSPVARIGIDVLSEKVVEYKSVMEKPFECDKQKEYFKLTDTGDVEEQQRNESEYEELYIKVREIAFKDILNDEEKNILYKYLNSFKKVVEPDLQPFLVELSHDFFRWLIDVFNV